MFDLQRFLDEQELSPERVASALRVSSAYIRSVLAGTTELTQRDATACAGWAVRLARERRTAPARELSFLHSPERYTSGRGARPRSKARDVDGTRPERES